ncbi:hypothetical protein [Halolamina sp. C58]
MSEVVDAHGWEIALTDSEDGGERFEIVESRSSEAWTPVRYRLGVE